MRQIAAEEESGNMASDMEVRSQQKCAIEFLREERITTIDLD
jgi:hypothetical protein